MRIHPATVAVAFFLVSCSSAPNVPVIAITAVEARLIRDDEYARLQVETFNPFHAYESLLQKPKLYFVPIVVNGSIARGDVVSIEAIRIERSEDEEPARIWLRGDLLGYWSDYDLGGKVNQRIERIIRARLPSSRLLETGRSFVEDVIIAVVSSEGGKPEAWRAVLSVNGEPLEFSGSISPEAPFLSPPRMF